MKRLLLSLPFVVFGGSMIWLTRTSDPKEWMAITALSSFVLSLLVVPIISRRSLLLGYTAIIFTLLVAAVSIVFYIHSEPPPSQSEVAKLFVNDSIKVPLACYRMAIGHYPMTAEGLDALVRCPKGLEKIWKGPYVASDHVPLDPWGRPYQYRCPGIHNPKGYDVWSLGPDGKSSEDDIGNWSR